MDRTKRWETPAPWNEEYRNVSSKVSNRQVRRVFYIPKSLILYHHYSFL